MTDARKYNRIVSSIELGGEAFKFFSSIGYPEDIFLLDVKDFGIDIDEKIFHKAFGYAMENHKKVSRKSMGKKFKDKLGEWK